MVFLSTRTNIVTLPTVVTSIYKVGAIIRQQDGVVCISDYRLGSDCQEMNCGYVKKNQQVKGVSELKYYYYYYYLYLLYIGYSLECPRDKPCP